MNAPAVPAPNADEPSEQPQDIGPGLAAFREQLDASVLRLSARVLGLIAAGCLLQMASVWFQAGRLDGPALIRLASGGAVFLVAATTGLIGSRQGPRPATAFFCWATMGIVGASAWLLQTGVGSSALQVLGGLIVLMGLLVGPRAALQATGASLGLVGLLWGAQAAGWIVGARGGHPAPVTTQALIALGTLAIIGAVVARHGRWFWDALGRLDSSRALLAETLREQQRHARELQIHRDRLSDEVALRSAELHDEQRRLVGIIESLPMTLCLRDNAGRFLMVNRQFEAATGLRREDIVGRHLQQVLPRDEAAAAMAADEAVLSGIVTHTRAQVLSNADGFEHDILRTSLRLTDGHEQPWAVLSLGTDVSSLTMLHRELAEARDEALRLARVKSEFLTHMSHEIRTPMNAVLGFAQLGLAHSRTDSPEHQAFDRITRSGRHLLGLINDVLEFSRIESGQMQIEALPCDLRALADAVVLQIQPRADEKQLKLEVQFDPLPAPCLLTDPLRLSQILLNLCGNAVKFTPSGRVRLHVQLGTRADRPEILFDIEDTGIGIEPQHLERIFRAFEQADGSTTRLYGGTGLGLSISRDLARLMGGDIEASSVPAIGSRFRLRLPWRPAEAITDPPVGPPPPLTGARPLQGARVLVVDDVELNRILLEDMLTDAGAVVHLAENGAMALQQVGRLWPGQLDLVLMDVHMPVMDGLQAASALRQTCPALPVLALTAHALPEQRALSAATGMRAHLSKPVEQAALIATVLSHLPERGSPASPPPLTRGPARADPPWPADAVPGIDLHQALGRCAGKTELLLELLMRFTDDQADIATEIAGARRQGSIPLGRLVHRLKGVAANMTMDDLHDCAGAVEDLLEQEVTGPALALALDDLTDCVTGLCRRLRAWLPGAAEAAALKPGPR